jgi:phage baseplate assembly protein gpV
VSADLLQTIRRIVQQELAGARGSELAVVEDIHPHAGAADSDNYACSVRLRDSGLLLRSVPVATQRIGAVSIPAPGELVLVQFIGGELNAPVITGRLYNDQDRPPPSDAGQAVLHLPLGASDAEAVHVALLSGDSREISIRLGDGLRLVLRDDDPVLEVAVDGGKGTLQLDRDGALTVKSGGAIHISGSDVAVEASGTLTLKGATVNIN